MAMTRTVATVFGAIYIVVGLVGFVLDTPLLGLFEVNPLLNLVHILLGAVLLYGITSTPSAIVATRAVGAVLVLLGVLGIPFANGFSLLPLGGNNIWLHLASGAILLVAGFLGESAESRNA